LLGPRLLAFCNLPWRFRFRPTRRQQLFKRCLGPFAKIHILVSPQRIRQRAIGQQQRDEPAAGIARIAEQDRAAFEGHPIRPQRRRRQTQHLHAGRLQPVFDGQVDIVARPDDPFVEPYPQPGAPQPFRQLSHARLVL
jgi:hypothetical protein